MRRSRAHRARPALIVVVALLATLAFSGCSQSSASTTASTAGGSSSGTTESTIGSTTSTSLPLIVDTPESRAYAADLKRTAYAVSQLSSELSQTDASEDDPRVATVYALRARAQAITAAKACYEKQLPLADQTVRELRSLLGRAKATAEGSTAEAVAAAQDDLQGLGTPSSDPPAARTVLDAVSADLAPLMPSETTATS